MTRLAAIVGALLALAIPASADEPLLRNGEFRDWEDGAPVGWTVAVGATTKGDATSRLEPVADGGLRIEGDASVGRWLMVSQTVKVSPGTTYRVSFEARLVEPDFEPGQRENAHVAVLQREASGPKRSHRRLYAEEWAPEEFLVRSTSDEMAVEVFFSMSGAQEVRRLSLEPLRAEDSYDALVRNMGRYYPTFAIRGIDWKAHAARFRDRARDAKDPDAFVGVLKDLLGPLEDLHVWIARPGQPNVATWLPSRPGNYDYKAVRRALRTQRQIGNVALVGELDDDIGVLIVGSLVLQPKVADEIAQALEGLFSKRGLIVDLRANTGGDETHAQRFVSRLADERRVYARRSVRSGPKASDLTEPDDVFLEPAGEGRYAGPIVCLLGPDCVSSGEGIAQMLDAHPNVTTVGQPTRGASANPQPVELPNGVTVWYSRWVNFRPDGSVLERKGVPPDVVVEHVGAGDPTFDAGVKVLREKLAR
jgi:hypothetical protein